MRIVVAALTGSLALALGACGGTTADDLAAIDAVTDKAGFSVGLVKHGTDETVVLRVPTEVGLEQAMTTEISMTMKVEAQGHSQTAETSNSQDSTLRITAVEGDEIVVESTIDRASVDMGGDTQSEAIGQAIADGVVGTVSTQRWTDRGAIISASLPDFDVDLPTGSAITSAQMNQLMNQMKSSMEDNAQAMSIPVPVEAVGVGTQWRATAKLSILGMPMKMSTTVTVTDISADEVISDIEQTITYIPGDVEIEGQTVQIKGGEMNLDGTIRYPRTGAIAPLVDMAGDGTVEMKVRGTTIKQGIQMSQVTRRK